MHADQGAIAGVGEGLGVHHAHQQRAYQPRSLGDRHRVHGAPAHARLDEGAFHDRGEGREVRPARELGDDAAEDLVHVLRQDDEARELRRAPPSYEYGCRRLVAGVLDSQHDVSHGPSCA